MELKNISGIYNQINSLKNNKETEKQEPQKDIPQLKEHCSSKAAKALRGMALGLALAAGVAAAGSKGIVVQAANNNSLDTQNNTTITQEVENNAQTSEVEKMVDNALDEQSYSTLYVGGKTTCSGEMRETRNYESAEINSNGQLVFLDQSTEQKMVSGYQLNYNGKYEFCSRMQTDTVYSPQNSFELGAEVNNSNINLQPGARFNESVEKNGDYVELAEDGKTFIVYDSSGKEIGSCKFNTPEEFEEQLKTVGKIGGIAALAVAGVTAGIVVPQAIHDKKYFG